MAIVSRAPPGPSPFRLAFLVLTGAGAVTLILSEGGPLGLAAIAAAPFAAALGLYLLLKPSTAFYTAFFLFIIPPALIPTEFEGVQALCHQVTTALAVVSLLLDLMFRRRPVVMDPAIVALAAYICWAAASFFWAGDAVAAWRRIVDFAYAIVFLLLAVNSVETAEEFDRFMRVIAGAGWLLVIVGLVTAFTAYRNGERLQIGAINQNQVVLYLSAYTPAVLWPALRSKGGWRLAHFVSGSLYLLLSGLLVALTGSRGGAISMALLLMSYLFSKQMRPWGLLSLIVVVGGLIAAPFLLDTLANRANESWGGQLGGRDVLWQASLMLIKQSPIIGQGIGNGPDELVPFVFRLDPYFWSWDKQHTGPSHNPFLEITIDTGVIGLILYLLVLVTAVRGLLSCHAHPAAKAGRLAGWVPNILCAALAYFFSWLKCGGVAIDPSLVVLLACLLVSVHILRLLSLPHPSPTAQVGRLPPERARPTPSQQRTRKI